MMSMSSAEYMFLEQLALDTKYSGIENTEYGSLMLESTIGRRFIVETLFLEAKVDVKSMGVMGSALNKDKDKNRLANSLAKEFNKLIVMAKKSGNTREAKRLLQAKKEMMKTYGIYFNNDSKSSKDGLSIIERFKKIFYSVGDWGKEVYKTTVSFIKKHPYKSVAIAMAVVSFITYILVEQRDLAKKILVFIRNMVTFPFRKIYQGLTWVISKILGNSKHEFSESVINHQFTYCTGLYESVLFLTEAEGDKIKNVKENIFKKVWAFITKYGWKVPKRVAISAVFKYTSLFYKDIELGKIDKIQKELDGLLKEYNEYKKLSKGENVDEKIFGKEMESISQQIENKRNELTQEKSKFIKEHWKPILITLVTLAVIISIAIYVYKKNRQNTQNA